MNNEELYKQIFRRKSFHLFRNMKDIPLQKEELDEIIGVFHGLTPLIPEIRTDICIIPEAESSCHRGNEYTIYFYSEIKDNYLQNIGYLGEQLDLYLTQRNIGALWFGIGKPANRTYNDLQFVIMMGIRKVSADAFRKDMFKSKRKELSEIWNTDSYTDIGNIARFAPSACNTQPWLIEGNDYGLRVYRYRKEGKRGIIPIDKVTWYNRIDIGIFLLFMEICMKHENLSFERVLYPDNGDSESNKVKAAEYTINNAD